MATTEDYERGSVYLIRSRNLAVGVYDGDGGFIGIREKFGDEFLFKEYLAIPRFGPIGTVHVTEMIGTVATDIEIKESLGTACRNCGGEARWTGPPAPAPWECEGGCEKPIPAQKPNTPLEQVLREFERLTDGQDRS